MANGMEMMLRSLGLGQVLDMANQLAENGTLDKILQFAEKLDEHNALLRRIADALDGGAIKPVSGSEPLAIAGATGPVVVVGTTDGTAAGLAVVGATSFDADSETLTVAGAS